MAGNRQQSRFLALVSNYDEYTKTLQIAEDSEGQGAVQYLKTMDSVSTKIQEVKTAWQQLYASLGIEKIIKGILNIVTKVMKQLASYKIGALISSLVQNFIVLKKVLKLAFNSGDKYLNSFTQKFNEAKNKMQEPIQITLDTSKAEQQLNDLALKKQQVNNGTYINASNISSSSNIEGLNYSFVKDNAKEVDLYLTEGLGYEVAKGTFGDNITEQQWNKLLNIKKTSPNFLQSFYQVEETLQDTTESVSRFSKAKEWLSIPKHLSGLAMVLQVAGSSLQALSLTISPNSNSKVEGNKILSGLGSITSGAGMGLSVGAMLGYPVIGAAIGAAISGITGALGTIFDGFSVDYDERRKMLEEEATELTATQTEKKGEETNLKNTIQTYEELAAKQYDSAEAAQELQDHMNTMAEQYPSLVAYYDEAGNAIIDVEAAEKALAKARYETSKATVETTKNELAQKQNDLDELNDAKADVDREIFYSFDYNQFDEEQINDIFTNLTEEQANYINELLQNPNATVKASDDKKVFFGLGRLPGTWKAENPSAVSEAVASAIASGDPTAERLFGSNLVREKLGSDSISNVSEDVFKASFDIQQYFISLVESYGELIDFDLKNIDETNVDELWDAWQTFNQRLNGQIDSIEEQLNTSGELVAKTEIRNALDSEATTNSELFERVDEYGSLMSQIGLQMLKAEDYNLDEAVKEDSDNYNEYVAAKNSITETLSNLTTDELANISEIWGNFDYYGSTEQVETALEKAGFTDDGLITGIVNGYTEQVSSIRERVLAAINNSENISNKSDLSLLFNGDDTWSELSTAYADKFVSWLNTIDDYAEQGLITMAAVLERSGLELFSQIGKIGPAAQEAVFGIVSKINWTDASSIQTAIDSISDLDTTLYTVEEQTAITSAMNALEDARRNLYFNIETELNLTTEAYKDAAEDAEKIQKYAESGMSWSEMEEQFTKLKASSVDGVDDLTINGYAEYDAATNSFILTKEGLNLTLQAQAKEIEEHTENVQSMKETLNDLSFEGLVVDDDTEKLSFENTNYSDKQKEIIEEYYKQWQDLGETEGTGLTFSEYAEKIRDEQIAAAESSQEIFDAYNEEYSQLAIENARQLSEIKKQNGKIDKFREYALKTSLTDEEIEEYATLRKLHFDNYKGLLLNQGAIQKNDNTGNYDIVDFDAYWRFLGKELEKGTDAYLEARASWAENRISESEKQAENIKSEVENIFSGKTGDLIDLTYLENLLGEDVLQELGFSLEENLYQIGEEIGYIDIINEIKNSGSDAIGSSLAELEDQLISLFNDWASLLDKGLSGSLSFEEADVLKNQFGLSDLDFTQTAEGLKISQNAAFGVLSTLRETDKVAGKIATTKMAENLAKVNEEYDDIYSVMRKIDEINEEIVSSEISDDRKKELEAELAVAKEIEQTLKEADNTFNFMDRDLPSGFDDPMSAWEGYGTAIGILNGDDWADGKADFTEFANMIDFMGDDILRTSEYFNDSTLTAASLIEAAAGAMRIAADGTRYVDLSVLGEQFNLSAEGMKAGIDDGIHEVAKSQIEMLDAAINMLETIIAIGEISDVDANNDGLLNFEEIFIGDKENPTSFTDEYITYLNGLKEALKKAGIDISEIVINGNSINELLTTNFSDWEKLGLTWEQYLAIINALVTASQSEDFDSNNADKVLEQIGQSLSGVADSLEIDGKKYEIKDKGMIITDTSTGEATFIASDGSTHSLEGEKDTYGEQIQTIEHNILSNAITGGKVSSEDTETKITHVEGVEFNYAIDNEAQYWYNGSSYSSYDDMYAAMLKDKIFSETGTTAEEPITIGDGKYIKVTLPTGEILWQSEDGQETYSNEYISQKIKEQMGIDEVNDIPLDVETLSISSVKNVEFAEGVIPENGISYSGDISISPDGITINLPSDLTESSITLLSDLVTNLTSLQNLGQVATGATVTLTGINDTNTNAIKDYNDAASSIPEAASSSVTATADIPLSVITRIMSLKSLISKMEEDGTYSAEFIASASEATKQVVKDILAVYGISGETAELIFNAIDQDGTVASVKTQIDGIVGKEVVFTASLDHSDFDDDYSELTQPGEKVVQLIYESSGVVGPTGNSKYNVYGTSNTTGYTSLTTECDSAEIAAANIVGAIGTGTFQNGTFTLEKIESDGSKVSITGSTVEILTELLSGGSNGGDSGDENGSGSISFDLSGITALQETLTTLGTTAGTTDTALQGTNTSLSDLDTSPINKAILQMASLVTAIKNIPSSGASRINTLSQAIRNIPSSSTITINYKIAVSTTGAAGATGTIVAPYPSSSTSRGKNSLSGALAKGNRTLMGELGPELVVSDGHYFTVGNNGAEFVDLADDAIVFNHLQTKKLLSSGSSGRGTPVTNEKKATSLATGNAMASATTALAELKQIRAMWESLLNASSKDLGSKAGNGGGGGGGEDTGAVEYDLERWYNLLRQIAKLEQQITYEQAKRENMRSGFKYVDSLEKELELLEKQYKAESELASLQKDYYLKRAEEVNNSAYGKIFTYDEDGLMQFVDGENMGLDALAKLQARDSNGALEMSAKQQYDYIINTLGVDKNDLKYKSDGTEAETDEEKVQVFFDNVDALMEELDGLYDDYNDHATNTEELLSDQNEILQEYIDNQLSLESKVLQAIEDREQAEIDRLTDEKEALEEATQNYIDGLSEALSKEQDLYNKNQTDEETAKLQRRLAILQRSGGSASEIKSLQDQIDSRLQDAYFQAQQDQIDAIQEAANKQLEKLQTQIDLMTEALEYQKENGLLWNEVYEVMKGSSSEITQFIEEYTQSLKENSKLQNDQDMEETKKEAEIYVGKRDKDDRDNAWNDYYANANYDESIKEANKAAAQEAFNTGFASGGSSAGEAAANKIFNDATAVSKKDENSSTTTTTTPTEEVSTTSQSGSIQGRQVFVRKKPKATDDSTKLGTLKSGGTFDAVGYKNGWLKVENAKTSSGKKSGYINYSNYKKYYRGIDVSKLPAYAQGGLVDFTGPAWVDGSKSKPEAFLSASDTALLKSSIFSNGDNSLKVLVAAIEEITGNSSSYSPAESSGIVIENATVNIQPGTISNDYDARRAGEMALEEMIKIARKTTNKVVSRR